jgi:hypothetical protein
MMIIKTITAIIITIIDGDEWSGSLPVRCTPGERIPSLIGRTAGWFLEPFWKLWRGVARLLPPPGIKVLYFRSTASNLVAVLAEPFQL